MATITFIWLCAFIGVLALTLSASQGSFTLTPSMNVCTAGKSRWDVMSQQIVNGYDQYVARFAAQGQGGTAKKPRFVTIENEIHVPVIIYSEKKERWVPIRYVVYHNTPLGAYHPEYTEYRKGNGKHPLLVVIQWKGNPSAYKLREPIMFNGRKYDGSWASGSFVKSKRSFGLLIDDKNPIETMRNLMHEAESGGKWGRACVPNALCGAFRGDLRIGTYADGTIINGWVVADGIGYIKESTWRMSGFQSEPIKLGAGRNNLQLWQHLDWDRIKTEVLAMLESFWRDAIKSGASVGLPNKTKQLVIESMSEASKELIKLNPRMEKHPWIVSRFDEATSDWLRITATTIPTDITTWLAVPSERNTIPEGLWAVARYPVVNALGIRAIEGDGYVNDKFSKIIAASQVTITNKTESIKALLVVVPDNELPKNVDIVHSGENWKLGKHRQSCLDIKTDKLGHTTKNSTVLDLKDAVLSVINVYGPERIIGLNPKWFKAMSGDFDGDLIYLLDLNNLPETWAEIKRTNDPYLDEKNPRITGKGEKTHTSIDHSNFWMENAMGVNVGMPTNLMSTTLCLPQSERWMIANNMRNQIRRTLAGWKIEVDGEITTEHLDDVLGGWIQMMVDSIKSLSCKTRSVTKTVNDFMSTITGGIREDGPAVFNCGPSYIRWAKMPSVFKTVFPVLRNELPIHDHKLAADSDKYRESDAWQAHPEESTVRGIIGQIWMEQREFLKVVWDKRGGANALSLAEFASWAIPVPWSDCMLCDAIEIAWIEHQAELKDAQEQHVYDPTDPEDVAEARSKWIATANALANKLFNGDLVLAKNAAWRYAHRSHRTDHEATGAWIFNWDMEFVKKLVAANAGDESINKVKSYLLGVAYHFEPGYPGDEITCRVKVVNNPAGKGRIIIAQELCDGLLTGGDDGFPLMTVGVVNPIESAQRKKLQEVNPEVPFDMPSEGYAQMWATPDSQYPSRWVAYFTPEKKI